MCLEWSEEKFRLPVFALVAGWSRPPQRLVSPIVGTPTDLWRRTTCCSLCSRNLQPKHKAWPIGKVQGQYKCKVHGKDPRTVSCGMRFKSRLPRSFLAHRPVVLVALHKATFPAVARWPEEHKSTIRRSVVITTGHEPLPRSLDAPGTI
jgi:hypothetical protein